jgi:hypothetical protein
VKSFILSVLFLTVSACAHTPSFTNAKTTGHGSDQANSLCEKFNLTDNEVLAFFKKSEEVVGIAIHYEYDYLPCYVKGTISVDHDKTSKKCEFTIRAGGTSELACPNEEAKFYACKKCDDLLLDKP